jgi:transposase IS116/IS110/IS902 family protein
LRKHRLQRGLPSDGRDSYDWTECSGGVQRLPAHFSPSSVLSKLVAFELTHQILVVLALQRTQACVAKNDFAKLLLAANSLPRDDAVRGGSGPIPLPSFVVFHLAGELERIAGVRLTRIGGVDVVVAQTLASEAGVDMGRWKTEAHFASWLGLCPNNRISGDKVLARGARPRHFVSEPQPYCQARPTSARSYRCLRTRLGAPKAITAMAHRLARLVYRMLKYGQHYVDKGAEYYERRNRQQLEFVRRRAAQLGLQVTPIQA